MIQVENLRKSFDLLRAVDDISFHIRRGEVVGFLGPNGAGKTTTMRLLTSYLSPDAGRIRIRGIDVEQNPLGARQAVGYLPESAPLYNDLSVIEYLEYIAAIRHIPKEQRKAKIRAMVSICGLQEMLSRNVGVLSKGYRQRVGLAQTMIHDPDVLILDEPTTGLDPNQRVEIRELIKAIGREKTIIISTHILSEVQATCGRILIINRGRIVADDTPEALAERTRGEAVYRIRAKGGQKSVEAALREAPFVASFEAEGERDGVLAYEINGPSGEMDLGEELFKLAVAHGFVLVEIRKEAVSLESVFASLTLKEDGA